LYPNWLIELASKALRRNPLRQRLFRWMSLGAGVHDIDFVHYVLMHGAPVAPQHAWPAVVQAQPNHNSALAVEAKSSVEQQLVDEIRSGILLRFNGNRMQSLQPFGFLSHVHPMGAVEKLDGPTRVGWRIVHDYSFPKGGAVNDCINYLRLQYDKMDAALAYVARHKGCYMAKIDITAFFRHLPTDPSEWPLLCSLWDFGEGPELLVDTRIPFGLRHAPEVCCRFSAVVLGMLNKALVVPCQPSVHRCRTLCRECTK
jgi:hypothetical protein